MIRQAFIIYFNNAPLVVLQFNHLKTAQQQLVDYARDYSFDVGKLSFAITNTIGFDEVEDLLRLLPVKAVNPAYRYYHILEKYQNREHSGLICWTLTVFTVDSENYKHEIYKAFGDTAAEAIRRVLTDMKIEHGEIRKGLSSKYTG